QECLVAPQGELEQSLHQIWLSLLPCEQLGVTCNFFARGGHSLLATQVVTQIRQQLNREIAVKHLFEYPTIRGLSALLKEPLNDKGYSAIEPVVDAH
ncbi:phosphopantetheine-binding protein, partial [Aliikangiella sp. G2MR2-5]|uniref:phosphopantetheine-binding protein n=1 Tax=Aliikangiella sp. G2MR2-5 TaxID=2788943 RepID=UPI0018AB2E61